MQRTYKKVSTMGLFIFILVVVLGITLFIRKYNKQDAKLVDSNQKEEVENISKNTIDDDISYYISNNYKVFGLSPRIGFSCYELKGVNFRNLSFAELGQFKGGYAIAETDNEYDKCAVAIYNDKNTHVGYLPKGNKKTYNYILDNSGKVEAYGVIGYKEGYNGGDGIFYGSVCVKTGLSAKEKRELQKNNKVKEETEKPT